jgi:4-amino-4-deoxy-L-arabinose transferase-like glycosyltransferase
MSTIWRSPIIIFLLICLLGLCLRLYRLNVAPERLTIDEMSIGYNAFSILKTGRDEWGQRFPLIFRAFGDYKLPAYIYLTVPFVALFGLNTLSVRFISVIAGIIIILMTGLLARHLSHKTLVGYFAALLVAVSPWPVHLSRLGLESNLGLAFFVIGLFFAITAIEKPTRKSLIFAGLFFGLTWYTYIAFRVITALIVLCVFVYSLVDFKRHAPILLGLIVFGLTLLPLMPRLIDFSGTARLMQVSIFTDQGPKLAINEDRSFCFMQDQKILAKICPLFFNKPFSWLSMFSENYLNLISPTYLFLTGDTRQYLNVPGSGGFLYFLLPFYFLGIWWFFRHQKPTTRLIMLAFFLSPIPSALAEKPQAVRSSALIPFVAIFCALGISMTYRLLEQVKFRSIIVLATLALTLTITTRYFINYYYIYPAKYDDAAYPLPAKLGQYLNLVKDQFQKIYFGPIGPGLHMFVAYYTAYSALNYQKDVIWPAPDPIGFTLPQYLGKYEFGTKNLNDILASGEKNVLYIGNNETALKPTQTFTNFSGVYVEAQAFEIK